MVKITFTKHQSSDGLLILEVVSALGIAKAAAITQADIDKFAEVSRDFPKTPGAGSHPPSELDMRGHFQGLMDELGKLQRVAGRAGVVTEVLLVIDATTGQNGLAQARVFGEVVPLTGVVLTKLDGTAKGGIVIAVQHELGVPVKLVGLGESADDLVAFDPADFVERLLG